LVDDFVSKTYLQMEVNVSHEENTRDFDAGTDHHFMVVVTSIGNWRRTRKMTKVTRKA